MQTTILTNNNKEKLIGPAAEEITLEFRIPMISTDLTIQFKSFQIPIRV